jgi:hypothetical protein
LGDRGGDHGDVEAYRLGAGTPGEERLAYTGENADEQADEN